MKPLITRNTPEQEAAIQRGITDDLDNPEWTADDFARARPAAEIMPELVESWRRSRGPQKKPTKVLVSLRLERDVLEQLRASGPGWQTRAGDMLRAALTRS